jgi:hypothetical protein
MRNPVKGTGLRNKRLGRKTGRDNVLVSGVAQLISDLLHDQCSVQETPALYKPYQGTDRP